MHWAAPHGPTPGRARFSRSPVRLPGRCPIGRPGAVGVGIDLVGVAWWGGRMAEPVAFVGREGELSRLLAALARHRAIFLPTEGGAHETRVSSNPGRLAGDARLVLVVGDAGVGKTRFAAEGMARAGAGGMVMVRGE